jgi:prepilin-type N-terminal cleavage/methylation domain-containing protein/prepilin-type processing-associated H-X9-DG protein
MVVQGTQRQIRVPILPFLSERCDMVNVKRQKPSKSSGFTLVELLVVITIIGILMGLLIPAVQAARETARKTQCATQIRNLAQATIQEEMNKRQYPGWLQSFGWSTATIDPTDPNSVAFSPHKKIGGWAVMLLPYLDSQATYEIWTQDKYPVVKPNGEYTASSAPNLAIMQCPSSTTMTSLRGKNSYISNNGAQPFAAQSGGRSIDFATSMGRANGVFNNKYAGSAGVPVGNPIRTDDLKDGQGNTVLFTENLQALPWHWVRLTEANSAGLLSTGAPPAGEVAYPEESRYAQGFVWHYENDNTNVQTASGCAPVSTAHKINGQYNGQDIYSVEMTNAATMYALARPSSAHNGGVNMAFADGTSRFVLSSIDYQVYQALMTPRGKSSSVPFPEYVLTNDSL